MSEQNEMPNRIWHEGIPYLRNDYGDDGVVVRRSFGVDQMHAAYTRIAKLKAESDENHRGYMHASEVAAGWKDAARKASARIAGLEKENREQHAKLTKVCVEGGYDVCARCGEAVYTDEMATVSAYQKKIAELEPIVDKLPKFADGTPAFPGDEAHRCWVGPRGGHNHEVYLVGWDHEERRWGVGRYWQGRCADGSPISFEPYQPVENYYPTKQAAEEASKA